MKTVLRYGVKRVINSLGFDIRRVPRNAAQSEGAVADPVTAEYLPRLRGATFFDVPVSHARAFHAFGLSFDAQVHPFVRAFAAAQRCAGESAQRAALRAALADFYRDVCPATALDAIDLDQAAAPGLADMPAIGYLLPWSDKTVA